MIDFPALPDLRDDLTEVHNHVLAKLGNGLVAVGSYCDLPQCNRTTSETLLQQSLEYGGKEHCNTQTMTTPVMYHMLALRGHQRRHWGSGRVGSDRFSRRTQIYQKRLRKRKGYKQNTTSTQDVVLHIGNHDIIKCTQSGCCHPRRNLWLRFSRSAQTLEASRPHPNRPALVLMQTEVTLESISTFSAT
jgi:hypothetical protein